MYDTLVCGKLRIDLNTGHSESEHLTNTKN